MKVLSYNILAKSYTKYAEIREYDFLKWENKQQYLADHILKHDSDIALFQKMQTKEESYNFLREKYADFLKWENRKQYLVDHIKKYDSDILLFQEMEKGEMYDFLHEEFASIGYDSHFLKRAKDGKNDGVATFYRRDKFSSVSHEEVELKESHDEIEEEQCRGVIQGRVALISRFKTNDDTSINAINIHLDCVRMEHRASKYDGYFQIDVIPG